MGRPRFRGAIICLGKDWGGRTRGLCGLEAPASQGGGRDSGGDTEGAMTSARGRTSQTRETQMRALTLGAPEGAGEEGGGLSSDRSNAEWAALRGHTACWGRGGGQGRLPGGGGI